MYKPFRKFVAILMLMWLPLFSGNALAVSVTMAMPASGHCHDETMQVTPDADMGNMDAGAADGAHDHDYGDGSASCHACGVCHLACTGYLAALDPALPLVQQSAREMFPYLVSFQSITLAPLVPPPLVRV